MSAEILLFSDGAKEIWNLSKWLVVVRPLRLLNLLANSMEVAGRVECKWLGISVQMLKNYC